MLWPFLSPQLTATDPFATWCKCLHMYASFRRTEQDRSQARAMFPSSRVSEIKASGQCSCPIEHFYPDLPIRACRHRNAARVSLYICQGRGWPEPYDTAGSWSREKEDKKELIWQPVCPDCSHATKVPFPSPSFTLPFFMHSCVSSPEQRAGTETLVMVAATTQFRSAFLIYFCFISSAKAFVLTFYCLNSVTS